MNSILPILSLALCILILGAMLIGKTFKYRRQLEKQHEVLKKKFQGAPAMLTDVLEIGDEFQVTARCVGYGDKPLDVIVICPKKSPYLKVCQLPPMKEVACEIANCNPCDRFVLKGTRDIATGNVTLSIDKVSQTPVLEGWIQEMHMPRPKTHTWRN